MSKLLLSILAAVFAVSIPAAARGQVAPDRVPTQPTGPVYKNHAFVGWGYTSLNQVNQSRSGLQGINGSYTRDFSQHFGVTAVAGHYAWDVTATNEGNPSVDLYLAGPELHANMYEKFDGYVRGLIGGAHTGGVSIQPDVSFAGGVGLGMDYNHSPRWGIRVFGDIIGSSFTLVPFQPGYSAHRLWNAHAGIGVKYNF